jgi:hypothetical protein
MGGAVAVILLKERQVAEAFERAGAVAAHRAIRPADISVEEGGVIWRRLRERAIIREASPGLYYLDVEGWQAQRRTRRRLALVMLIIVIAAMITAAITARGRFQ